MEHCVGRPAVQWMVASQLVPQDVLVELSVAVSRRCLTICCRSSMADVDLSAMAENKHSIKTPVTELKDRSSLVAKGPEPP